MYFADLLEEYKQLLKQMKSEGVTSGSMYQEVKQAIEWMETGYDPAEYRAATRIDSYSFDPYHMQNFVAYVNHDIMLPDNLMTLVSCEYCTNDEVNKSLKEVAAVKRKVNDAMAGLTKDERAVYIAIHAELMPFSKVAKMLDVSKSTVQSYYERACRKISNNVNKGSQLDMFEMIS